MVLLNQIPLTQDPFSALGEPLAQCHDLEPVEPVEPFYILQKLVQRVAFPRVEMPQILGAAAVVPIALSVVGAFDDEIFERQVFEQDIDMVLFLGAPRKSRSEISPYYGLGNHRSP